MALLSPSALIPKAAKPPVGVDWMEDGDGLARYRAEKDQALASMKEFAGGLWEFYKELRDRGFTRDEALPLTIEFMRGMMDDGDGESA